MNELRILMVFTDGDNSNPFVHELKAGLESAGCRVTWSLRKFWEREGDYDIVHLQWPEYMFIPGGDKHTDKEKLALLGETLAYWKKRAKIVITRHNIQPNYLDRQQFFRELYELTYSYCDGFVHLGPFDLAEFEKSNSKDLLGHPVLHTMIPHHIYVQSYTGQMDQPAAKRLFGIQPRKRVILIFGRVRYKTERSFLKKVFRATKGQNICFLIPTWLPFNANKGFKWKLRDLSYRLRLLFLNRSSHVFAFKRFVPDKEIHTYFDAADLMLIPRLEGLNSGNITLGYLFKKVVTGPAAGNMEYELTETANPTFVPGSLSSVLQAIDKGLQLTKENKGEKNYQYVLTKRHPAIIGRAYVAFFMQCMSARDELSE